MYIYLVMLVISLMLVYFSTIVKDSKVKKLFQITSCLPFFLISAFRYGVGTDYFYRYAPDYNYMAVGGNITNLEFGYKLFTKICILFSKNYYFLFFITSAIIISLIFYAIFKNSDKPFISILLFFTCGFFFQSMNVMREYIAISLLLVSYKFLINKKYFKWSIFVFLAFMFHQSSLIIIVTIFFMKKNKINIPFVLGTTLGIIVLSPVIDDIFTKIIGATRFSSYLNSNYDISGMNWKLLGFDIIFYFIIYYLYSNKKRVDQITREDNFFLNVQGFSVIIEVMSYISMLFFRLVYYFSIFQIISIPYLLKYIDSKEKKFKILVLIFIVMSLKLVYTNVLNNYEGILPYKTIFNVGG